MRGFEPLAAGYEEFRASTYPQHRQLYETLAEKGQSPETMVISCCDSRVAPTAIFNASPGSLFVVRNVANLVPPYAPDGEFHGTSAALEFAVTGLGVKRIVVMGHAKCGGVKAFLAGVQGKDSAGLFIDKWMSILEPARETALALRDSDPAEAQRAMEHAAIGVSMRNLMSFPFVRDRVTAGSLSLHGAYFDIGTGSLLTYHETDGSFRPVSPTSGSDVSGAQD